MTVNHWVAGSNPARGAIINMLSFFLIAKIVFPFALVFSYQYLKEDNNCFKNLHAKNKANLIMKKYMDEPFLVIISVFGTPVIIGAATNSINLEKTEALLRMSFKDVQNLANVTIGNWNYVLMNQICLQMFFSLNISSSNYHVYAIKKHVWIVGVAKTNFEKEQIIKMLKENPKVQSFSHYIVVSPNPSNGFVVLIE